MILYLRFYNVIASRGINIKNDDRNLNAERGIIPAKDKLARILQILTPRERLQLVLW